MCIYIVVEVMVTDRCRAMLGNPPPSSGAVRDVNSTAPEVENYEVREHVL